MALPIEEFPVPQRSQRTVEQIPTPDPTTRDPLIPKVWQREQYIGIFILFISLIAAVGLFSRRFEYALLFALSLSVVLIIFFLSV
ncbi:hypothetical protein IQ259_19240 [Fortiea sp. LEGE XX443]|uniref:hypothetical protein n=1 Tax=Fortiea sp. LEGE XX443 TaxID=1828611 RepID=UPI00187F9735|nr:hypothetical protein [Fortiea sp. LEGE XX443]MBE9007142.1 hypothetical protein [Fortiea sp. LEGE XX443]